jgi:hypothetical protein
MIKFADPVYQAFESKSKTTVGNAAIFSKIKIPVIVFHLVLMAFYAGDQFFVTILTLSPADYLAVSFGRKKIG